MSRPAKAASDVSSSTIPKKTARNKKTKDDTGVKAKTSATKKEKSVNLNAEPEEKITSAQIMSGEEDRKMDIKRGEVAVDKCNLPRITFTHFDDKGRMISTTFVCNPETLRFYRNEDYSFTKSGRKKTKLYINIEADVVEIEWLIILINKNKPNTQGEKYATKYVWHCRLCD